jgi:hypothetical protein
MLAMGVNDDAGCLMPRGVLESIASVLAPTGGMGEWGRIFSGNNKSVPFFALFCLSPFCLIRGKCCACC